jgi:putative endonuclease
VTVARQRLGRIAEEIAATALERAGAVIVARNARPKAVRGEIDIVALERGALVFVEVKALRAGARSGPERPALAVGPRKQAQVRRLARAWLAEAEALPRFAELRFDVVEVVLDGADRLLHHERIRGAF